MDDAVTFVSSKEAIAQRLRDTREALGYTQAEMARRVDISYQALSNYERAVSRIDLDQALRIVRATGVGLDWIYRGVETALPANIADGLREVRKLRATRTSDSPPRPGRKRRDVA